MVDGLGHPLAAARIVTDLFEQCRARGFQPDVSEDFDAFFDLRKRLRGGEPVAPLFDPAVTTLANGRAQWLSLTDPSGKVIGLQAFRADVAEPNLADWALGWILGIYLKRSELIIPEQVRTPEDSRTRHITGVTVYHGELWIDPDFRGRRLMEPFSRLGVILSHLKWRPAAIWALNSQTMAKSGTMIRMGYAHMERGFLKWQFLPEGADATEWVAIAEHDALDHMIKEMSVRLS